MVIFTEQRIFVRGRHLNTGSVFLPEIRTPVLDTAMADRIDFDPVSVTVGGLVTSVRQDGTHHRHLPDSPYQPPNLADIF